MILQLHVASTSYNVNSCVTHQPCIFLPPSLHLESPTSTSFGVNVYSWVGKLKDIHLNYFDDVTGDNEEAEEAQINIFVF